MAKKKGRQSNGFGSKSGRAMYQKNLQYETNVAASRVRREAASKRLTAGEDPHRRPLRLQLQLKPLAYLTERIVQENRLYGLHAMRERRRRDGYLPPADDVVGVVDRRPIPHVPEHRHPPGWMLRYGPGGQQLPASTPVASSYSLSPPTLQSMSLRVFASYLQEYADSMGFHQLHGVIGVLPAETTQELSVLLSSAGGMTDQSLRLVGCHPHIYALCIRPAVTDRHRHDSTKPIDDDEEEEGFGDETTTDNLSSTTVTDRGILELIPKLPRLVFAPERRKKGNPLDDSNDVDDDDDDADHVLDCWEDDDGIVGDDVDEDGDDEDNDDCPTYYGYGSCSTPDDHKQPQQQYSTNGCNIRLRRLELVDCRPHNVSCSVVVQLLEKCSGITHMSISGSTFREGNVEEYQNETILSELPTILPQLEVLDVTRCAWVTRSLLSRMLKDYLRVRQNQHRRPSQVRPNDDVDNGGGGGGNDDDIELSTKSTIVSPPSLPLVISDYGWSHHHSFDDDDW
jgi:hypothetical protein